MNFRFNDHQATVETAIRALADGFRGLPVGHAESFSYGVELDRAVVEAGFHDVCTDADLGMPAAVLVAAEIAKLPFCVEIAASTIVRPTVAPTLARPLALTDRPGRPIRFLPQARSLLILGRTDVKLVQIGSGDVKPVESLFAYPLGILADSAFERAMPTPIDPSELRRLWRVALAAEIYGAIESGLAATLEHVSQRQQFGRPIGAFQAVKHRLAEVAVLMHTLKWLTYRAASTGTMQDAVIACGNAQETARLAAHELHQFHGAIGLTLEYPLHLWTYRLKALLSELGGASSHEAELADLIWGEAA